MDSDQHTPSITPVIVTRLTVLGKSIKTFTTNKKKNRKALQKSLNWLTVKSSTLTLGVWKYKIWRWSFSNGYYIWYLDINESAIEIIFVILFSHDLKITYIMPIRNQHEIYRFLVIFSIKYNRKSLKI